MVVIGTYRNQKQGGRSGTNEKGDEQRREEEEEAYAIGFGVDEDPFEGDPRLGDIMDGHVDLTERSLPELFVERVHLFRVGAEEGMTECSLLLFRRPPPLVRPRGDQAGRRDRQGGRRTCGWERGRRRRGRRRGGHEG